MASELHSSLHCGEVLVLDEDQWRVICVHPPMTGRNARREVAYTLNRLIDGWTILIDHSHLTSVGYALVEPDALDAAPINQEPSSSAPQQSKTGA